MIGRILCKMLSEAYPASQAAAARQPRPAAARQRADALIGGDRPFPDATDESSASAVTNRCARSPPPFGHLADDRADLGRLLDPHIRIRTVGLTNFVDRNETETLLLAATMNGAMHEGFDYVWHEKVTTTGVSRFGAAPDRSGAEPEARCAVCQRLYLGSGT